MGFSNFNPFWFFFLICSNLLVQTSQKSISLGNTGSFIRSLPNNYIYETNYILTYYMGYPSQPIPPNWSQIKTSFKTMVEWTKSIEELETYWNDMTKGTLKPINLREKRFLDHGALPFVGWIQQKIGGVALTSDLDDLRVQSQGLSTHVSEIKEVLKHMKRTEIKLINDTTILHHEVELINEEEEETQKTLKILESVVQKQEMRFHYLDFIQRMTLRCQINTMRFTKYSNLVKIGYSTCLAGYLSKDIISPFDLMKELEKVAFELKGMHYELSIPSNLIEWYYQHKLVYCISNGKGFLMGLSIPIKSVFQNVRRFFELTYVPLRLSGENYMLGQGTLFGFEDHNGNTFKINQYESNCLQGNKDEKNQCLFRLKHLEPIKPGSCLHIMISGGSIGTYKKECNPDIHSSSAEWIKINSTSWIYSGPSIPLQIKCEKKLSYTLSIGGSTINSLIDIPCNCFVIDEHLGFLNSQKSCINFVNHKNLNLTSIFYLPYNDMQLDGHDSLTTFRFTSQLNLSKEIHQKINFSEDLDILTKDDKILNKATPIVSWSSSFHSIWYYVTWTVIGILIIFLVYWLVRNRKFGSTRLAMLSGLPQLSKASNLETNIEMTVDILLIIIVLIGFFIVIKLIKRLLIKFSCHNYKTGSFASIKGPHLDLVCQYYSTPICIGLKNINVPINVLFIYNISGNVKFDGNNLLLDNFPGIKNILGGVIDVNGSYPFSGLSPFETTVGQIKGGI